MSDSKKRLDEALALANLLRLEQAILDARLEPVKGLNWLVLARLASEFVDAAKTANISGNPLTITDIFEAYSSRG